MSNLRKHFGLALFMILAMVSNGPRPAYAANTDRSAISGDGKQNNIDVWRIDSNYDMHLATATDHDSIVFRASSGTGYQAGDIILRGDNAVPSSNSFPSYKVKFLNGSGAATVQGMVIVSSTTPGSTLGAGGTVSLTATTTVMGICDGVYANGAMGSMTISGYALVLATGTVAAGNVLVSSAPFTSGAKGYAGQATGTVVVGTVVGKALSSIVTDGLVLSIVSLQ